MAPRRGGGGSSSGGSISSCPNAFESIRQQVQFARDVIFFTVFLGIAIALCSFRKKTGAGRKLLGLPYISALALTIVGYACIIIATVLEECSATDLASYYDWLIAIEIFLYLNCWLLLVVVVWTLNTMLRAQLGHSTTVFKAIYIVIVAIMGALTCVLIGLACYNDWTQTQVGRVRYTVYLFDVEAKYRVAYHTLYLLSVLASGGLAVMTIMSLRSKRHPAGDLIGWVIALTAVMAFWVIIRLVMGAAYLNDNYYSWEEALALSWLSLLGQVLSFIFILCIAKHQSWNGSPFADPLTSATYYQQAPIYVGPANPPKA